MIGSPKTGERKTALVLKNVANHKNSNDLTKFLFTIEVVFATN
jgi:hypothetical protein